MQTDRSEPYKQIFDGRSRVGKKLDDDEMKDLLTATEVAAIMRCTRQHVYNLGRARKIKVIKLGVHNHLNRYTRKSVEDFMRGARR